MILTGDFAKESMVMFGGYGIDHVCFVEVSMKWVVSGEYLNMYFENIIVACLCANNNVRGSRIFPKMSPKFKCL